MGLNQSQLAEIGGVKRRAQVTYESGERCPDGRYFSAIAAAGADVNYILTGTRTRAAAPLPDTLNPEEMQLLNQYRQLTSAADKAMVRRVLAVAVTANERPTARYSPRPASL